METEAQIALMVGVVVLLLFGGLFATCNYQARLDAAAPVVESCIKHPATRSPFGNQGAR